MHVDNHGRLLSERTQLVASAVLLLLECLAYSNTGNVLYLHTELRRVRATIVAVGKQ